MLRFCFAPYGWSASALLSLGAIDGRQLQFTQPAGSDFLKNSSLYLHLHLKTEAT